MRLEPPYTGSVFKYPLITFYDVLIFKQIFIESGAEFQNLNESIMNVFNVVAYIKVSYPQPMDMILR